MQNRFAALHLAAGSSLSFCLGAERFRICLNGFFRLWKRILQTDPRKRNRNVRKSAGEVISRFYQLEQIPIRKCFGCRKWERTQDGSLSHGITDHPEG